MADSGGKNRKLLDKDVKKTVYDEKVTCTHFLLLIFVS